MLFNSWQFIWVFLPVCFFVYFALNRARLPIAGKLWLVAASLFFYAFWKPLYLPLIMFSLAANFALGTRLSPDSPYHPRHRRLLLTLGIAGNLLLLGFFKYVDFVLANINLIGGTHLRLLHIVLPLAISFFTFQQISYLVDSYRGETSEYNFLNYALFVCFFPHLIAGPLMHHRDVMKQFQSRWTLAVRYRNILSGLFLFTVGFFKKVVLADTFALAANAGFDYPGALDFFSAWSTSLSYTFQLYFDFSGYSDMAIGAGLLFNIRLPLNFNSPYKALDIQDFWRRWHMTLSRFLRDYLYIPLGGNRGGEARTYANLLITFTLGGLWHGASWMFVIWGVLHGLAMLLCRIWQKSGARLPAPIAWLTTFMFVNLTWVFFRAKAMPDALRVLRGMVDFGSAWRTDFSRMPSASLAWGGHFLDSLPASLPPGIVANMPALLGIVLAFVIISRRNSFELVQSGVGSFKLAGAAVMFWVAMLATIGATSSVFLYFNF